MSNARPHYGVPREYRVYPTPHSPNHQRVDHASTASRTKAKRTDRIANSVSKRLDRINSSCPIPVDSYSNANATPRKGASSRMFVDLVTPRGTPRVPPRKAVLSKGAVLPRERVPLGAKGVPNTPLAERKVLTSFPSKHASGLDRQTTYLKPLSSRSSLSKGLAPSPAQRRAPQSVEVIDLDSDGEAGQCFSLVNRCIAGSGPRDSDLICLNS